MKSVFETSEFAHLVPVAGPAVEAMRLSKAVAAAQAGGLVLGRQEGCELMMPADADKVSRRHARFAYDADSGRWRFADLGSRWGSFLNGAKLSPNVDVPLGEGDLIRIVPWTFVFSASPRRRAQMRGVDDAGMTMVRTVALDGAAQLQGELLSLLLEGTATMCAATDERALADATIDLAMRGTGLSNAALLRPVDAAGGVDVIASRFADAASPVSFSRSLLAAAIDGHVAEISDGTGSAAAAPYGQSIVAMGISVAITVPLKLGETVAAVLYLDHRGGAMFSRPTQARSFAVALGQMASLALANLKRVEVERRSAEVDADLKAAAVAQKWIMPKRHTTAGALTVVGESRAGQLVGGDFFDVIDLGSGKVAVALGDVSGHGVAAGVLMTATQGYLHATLKEHGDAAKAVTATNGYVAPRKPGSKFVTAWVGVFDMAARSLSYVDAGHGFALLRRADGSIESLAAGEGMPIGIMDDSTYAVATVPLRTGDSLLIVSDGILEQSSRATGEPFEMDRLKSVLTRPATDVIADLFAAVYAFAGTEALTDDATAVLVRW